MQGAAGEAGRAWVGALVGIALGAAATFFAARLGLISLPLSTQQAAEQTTRERHASADSAPAKSAANNTGGAATSGSNALLDQLRAGAAVGNARAQSDLGVLYQLGQDVEQSDSEAIKWYRKAAERNFALAQSNLGWMIENGRGVDKDPVSALFWYRLAAQSGDVNGQFNLAGMYERGVGIARDRVLALEWYEKAAAQGDEAARAAAARLRDGLQQEEAQAAGESATAAAPNSGDLPSATATAADSSAAATRSPEAAQAATAQPEVANTPSTALSLSVEVDNAFDGTGYSGTWHQRAPAGSGVSITYQAQTRADGVVVIVPSSPLHEPAAQPVPLAAGKSASETLKWQFPRLILRIANDTSGALRTAALELRSERSEAERGALVLVPNEASTMLELENVGWGTARQPEVKLGFDTAEAYSALDPQNAATTTELQLDDFDESLRVALQERAPPQLRAASVTVFGTLSYADEAGARRVLPFKSLVHFNRSVSAPRWQPRFFYHALLKTDSPGNVTLPLDLSVAPQSTAQLKLRLASDRSARHQVVLAVKAADGALLAMQRLDLRIFVPRYDSGSIAGVPAALRLGVR